MSLISNESHQDVPGRISLEVNDQLSDILHDIPITPSFAAVAVNTNNNDKKMITNEIKTTETMTTTTLLEDEEGMILPELESPELQVGDHVYQWRSLLGVPYMFQHHGIVMDVIKDRGKPIRITIADFSNVEINYKKKKKGGTSNSCSRRRTKIENPLRGKPVQKNESVIIQKNYHRRIDQDEKIKNNTERRAQRTLSLRQEGILRTYTDTNKWYKVYYQSTWWKRQLYRSGTVTKAKSDSVGLVLARVHYIMQHPEQLPDYHVFHANCECVAFWCKTGRWSTLQASSFLELTAAGQVKSTACMAATAAGTTATITVPAAGIWGSWFGLTTTSSVSWLSLHPMAIPGLACYAAITVGIPAVMYATAKNKWKETSQCLSDAFWKSAMDNPEIFAECLLHWSEK